MPMHQYTLLVEYAVQQSSGAYCNIAIHINVQCFELRARVVHVYSSTSFGHRPVRNRRGANKWKKYLLKKRNKKNKKNEKQKTTYTVYSRAYLEQDRDPVPCSQATRFGQHGSVGFVAWGSTNAGAPSSTEARWTSSVDGLSISETRKCTDLFYPYTARAEYPIQSREMLDED